MKSFARSVWSIWSVPRGWFLLGVIWTVVGVFSIADGRTVEGLVEFVLSNLALQNWIRTAGK